jgi:hypothetical protein
VGGHSLKLFCEQDHPFEHTCFRRCSAHGLRKNIIPHTPYLCVLCGLLLLPSVALFLMHISFSTKSFHLSLFQPVLKTTLAAQAARSRLVSS